MPRASNENAPQTATAAGGARRRGGPARRQNGRVRAQTGREGVDAKTRHHTSALRAPPRGLLVAPSRDPVRPVW